MVRLCVRRRPGEAGFVFEDEPGSMGCREPSAQGHTSLTHPATALSSGSIALRAGTWQDQPLRANSVRTPWIEYVRWKRRPIPVLTQASVHRWSSQPCAAGPLASSASS